LECVPNVSEGRRPEVLAALREAVQGAAAVRLLGSEMDPSHHRAVLTFAGPPDAVIEAALRMARVAVERVDLDRHRGQHPRIGALDVLPFVPLGDTPMQTAIAAAHAAGARLWQELRVPVFFYGEAARSPERQNLAVLRRGQFEGLRERVGSDPRWRPDVGDAEVHPTAGATAVGARSFLIAFNVDLDSQDLMVAKAIARDVRERDGGLPCIKALGLYLEHRSRAQVSLNLTDFRVTSVRTAFDAVVAACARRGVAIAESELIGLCPRAALDAATARHVRLRGFDPKTRVIEEVLGR
jgi:glutamate formiminotransferase